ncbi:uncharacterized protein [Ranitomeya imitator]|uniref:uncharacterized protein n=1 Tax=Ranitomeya imitator TaxID=111125 RepID=UPI0037E95EA3
MQNSPQAGSGAGEPATIRACALRSGKKKGALFKTPRSNNAARQRCRPQVPWTPQLEIQCPPPKITKDPRRPLVRVTVPEQDLGLLIRYYSLHWIPKVPQSSSDNQRRDSSFPVYSHALRPFNSTEDLYQDNARGSRLDNQYQQIQTHSAFLSGVLGVPSRLRISKCLLPQLRGKDVRILSDNTTTVAYLNRQGGSQEGSWNNKKHVIPVDQRVYQTGLFRE